MIEAAISGELLAYLRQVVPKAVILKHADRTTIGVPDFSFTFSGLTTWVETKLIDDKRNHGPQAKLDYVISQAVQHATMSMLEKEGRAFYFIVLRMARNRGNVRYFHKIIRPSAVELLVDIGLPVKFEGEGKGYEKVLQKLVEERIEYVRAKGEGVPREVRPSDQADAGLPQPGGLSTPDEVDGERARGAVRRDR